MPEVGALPEGHQPKHVDLDAAPAGLGVPLQEVHLLDAPEDPEPTVDLDALGIEDPAVELIGQSDSRPAG